MGAMETRIAALKDGNLLIEADRARLETTFESVAAETDGATPTKRAAEG
jgi:hypothetical protein